MKLIATILMGAVLVGAAHAKRFSKDIVAYAGNRSTIGDAVTDKKEVPIPDECTYRDTWDAISTANPNAPSSDRWSRAWGVTRSKKTDKVLSVWVSATAGTKDSGGSGIWIGNALHVEYDCPD